MRKGPFILGQFSDSDVEWLVESGTRRRLAPGAVLIREGRAIDAVFVLLEGELLVTNAARTIHARSEIGDIVGEMSFIDASPPSATVEVAEAAVVLQVPRDRLESRLRSEAGFAARFYRAVARFLSDRLRARMAERGSGVLPGASDGEVEAQQSGSEDPSSSGRFAVALRRLSDAPASE